jgi:hypothetical protein
VAWERRKLYAKRELGWGDGAFAQVVLTRGVESEGEHPTAQAVVPTITYGARAGHALLHPIPCALLAPCSFFREYPLLLVARARLKQTWLRSKVQCLFLHPSTRMWTPSPPSESVEVVLYGLVLGHELRYLAKRTKPDTTPSKR